MDLKEVFKTLIDNIESGHTFESLGEGLYKTKLIRSSVHLGAGDSRNEMKEKINRADFDEITGVKVMNIAKVGLAEIYHNKQRRANKIFYLSLITVGVSISLIIIGLVIAFIEKDKEKLGFIISICSMFPGFLSGTAFWFYRNENNGLKPVEQDIRKIARIEQSLEMVQYISDEKQKANAYENIIDQMGSQGRFIVL